MINFSDGGVIHTVEEITDENGEEFIVINGSTYYPKKHFTAGEAKRDFKSEKSIQERADFEYRVWCD